MAAVIWEERMTITVQRIYKCTHEVDRTLLAGLVLLMSPLADDEVTDCDETGSSSCNQIMHACDA